jgi:hypothetical protein
MNEQLSDGFADVVARQRGVFARWQVSAMGLDPGPERRSALWRVSAVAEVSAVAGQPATAGQRGQRNLGRGAFGMRPVLGMGPLGIGSD